MMKANTCSTKTFLLLSVALIVACKADVDAKPSATVNLQVQDKIPSWMAEFRVPAVGIALIEGGKIKVARVFGEVRKGMPAPNDAIFDVASLTKPVFVLSVLKLVSEGKWDLDAPLHPYWVDSDIKDDDRHKKLTTRIILTHRTGFPNWRGDKKLAFGSEPGAKYQYSGEGFEYLKRALERKFNKPLAQLVSETVLKPLRMTGTRFLWDESMPEARFASPHNTEGNPLDYYKQNNALASDGLLTTVRDYGRFGSAVINGAGLSPKLFKEMVRPQVVTHEKAQIFFGLGWELVTGLSNDEYMLMHTGSDSGCNTLVMLFPKSKRGLVVLTNGDNGHEIYKRIVPESMDVGKEFVRRVDGS